MKFLSYMAGISAIALVAGCSSSSDSNDEATSSVAISGDLALPEQMSLVTAKDESSASASGNSVDSGSALVARTLTPRAVLDTSTLPSDSDYVTARQNTYVWLEAIEPIGFIDSLLCFTNQSRPLAMLDQGDYISWNDAMRCFEDQGESGGDDQGQGGNQAQQFVTIVANSSQASDSDPVIFNGWVEDYAGQSGENEGPTGIKILGEIRQTPTDENPFGEFTLTYGLLPSIDAAEANNEGFGEVVSSETTDGGASFTLYQEDTFDEQGQTIECTTTASVDYNEATDTGKARTGRNCSFSSTAGTAPEGFNAAFALAVNSDFVHMGVASSYADIPDNLSKQACLARDDFNSVVWNYSLYNKADGSAVQINSGMQLKVDANNNTGDGFESWGHIGYWGAWREDGQSFSDGEAVQQATFDGTQGEEFTVKVSPGKLVKNSIESVALSDLAGVRFNAWIYEGDTFLLDAATDFDGDSNTTDSFELVLEKNSTNDGFDAIGYREFTENGETVNEFDSAVAVELATGKMLHMWSRQLGGNVRYIEGTTEVRFFERTFVNGSETGTGELFSGGTSVTLKCFNECLDANLSATDFDSDAARDDVYVSNANNVAQDYTFAQSDLTLKASGSTVGLASDVTQTDLETSMFWQWGLNSGPMITSTVASSNSITTSGDLFSKIASGAVTEFYTWETGLEPWQQQIRLVDESENVQTFDKPVTIKYVHATVNDRNGDATYDGKTFLLEYGGRGQLWGLPFEQNGDRWGPVINLKDGTILGSSDQYIIKANDVEQKMDIVAASNCADLPLDEPSQAVPTGISGAVFDIGTMPEMGDEPPSVIDGEIQE